MIYVCYKYERCEMCNIKYENRTNLKKHTNNDHEFEPSDDQIKVQVILRKHMKSTIINNSKPEYENPDE